MIAFAVSAYMDNFLAAPSPIVVHGLALSLSLVGNTYATVGVQLGIAILIIELALHICQGLASFRVTERHATMAAWVLVAFLADRAESSFLAGVFIVCASGVVGLTAESLPYFALWLLRVLTSGDLIGPAVWGPILLLMLGSLKPERASERAASQLEKSSPSESVALDKSKVVRHFPGWVEPSVREARAWTQTFAMCDEVLAIYSCTLCTDLPVFRTQSRMLRCVVAAPELEKPGQLFLSLSHVSFKEIGGISPVRFILPLTNVEKVLNAGGRGVATIVFNSPVPMGSEGQLVKTIELRDCEHGSLALSMLLSLTRHGDSDTSDDGSPSFGTASSSGSTEKISSTATEQTPCCTTPSREAEDVFGGSEPLHTVYEGLIPNVFVEAILEDVLADEWSDENLLISAFRAQGASEFDVSPWRAVDEGGNEESDIKVKERELKMRLPVPPAPMCPKTTMITKFFRCSYKKAGNQSWFRLQASSTSHDVPFCSFFHVQDTIEFSPDAGGISVKQDYRVVFVKSVGILRGKISSAAADGVKNYYEYINALLRQRAPVRQPEEEPLMVSVPCNVEIWEVQRRRTVFSTDWRAPFLPHDAGTRWRWVDKTYQRHPWTQPSRREDSIVAELPPLEPERGWQAASEWKGVIRQESSQDKNATDADGWQYAIDIYYADKSWQPECSNLCHHVRRRLWTRTYVMTAAIDCC